MMRRSTIFCKRENRHVSGKPDRDHLGEAQRAGRNYYHKIYSRKKPGRRFVKEDVANARFLSSFHHVMLKIGQRLMSGSTSTNFRSP